MEVGQAHRDTILLPPLPGFFVSQEKGNLISQKKSRDPVYLSSPEDCLLVHLHFFKSSVVNTFAGDLSEVKTNLRVCGQAI